MSCDTTQVKQLEQAHLHHRLEQPEELQQEWHLSVWTFIWVPVSRTSISHLHGQWSVFTVFPAFTVFTPLTVFTFKFGAKPARLCKSDRMWHPQWLGFSLKRFISFSLAASAPWSVRQGLICWRCRDFLGIARFLQAVLTHFWVCGSQQEAGWEELALSPRMPRNEFQLLSAD